MTDQYTLLTFKNIDKTTHQEILMALNEQLLNYAFYHDIKNINIFILPPSTYPRDYEISSNKPWIILYYYRFKASHPNIQVDLKVLNADEWNTFCQTNAEVISNQ
jgi:hypothetical protein